MISVGRLALLAAPAGGSSTTISAVTVDAAGSVPTPTILVSATVAAVTVDGTGSVPTPSIVTGVIVSAVTVDAGGSVPSPSVTASTTIAAVTVGATGTVHTPTVAGPTTISAVTVSATGTVYTPTVGATAATIISAVTVQAYGFVYTPFPYGITNYNDKSTPRASIAKARRLVGCERTVVMIANRSMTQGSSVSFSSVRWGRTLSALSTCGLTVPDLNGCQSALVGVRPWSHSLVIVRGGVFEWGGPIVRMGRLPGGAIRLDANDRLGWLMRRNLHRDHNFEAIDLGVMAKLIVQDAFELDPPFPLDVSEMEATGVSAQKQLMAGSEAIGALRDCAAQGGEWTVFRDRIIGANFRNIVSPGIVVGQEAFEREILPEFDGMAQATSVTVSASGSGGSDGKQLVTYGDWLGSPAGLLEENFNSYDAGIQETLSGLYDQAKARWEVVNSTPVVLPALSLSGLFPNLPDVLQPGLAWRVRHNDPVFESSGDYRLRDVDWEVSASASGEQDESVSVTLQRMGASV